MYRESALEKSCGKKKPPSGLGLSSVSGLRIGSMHRTQWGKTECEWSWIDDLCWLLKANFLILYQYYWGKTPKSLPQKQGHQTVQELKNLSFVFRKMLMRESSSVYFVQVRRDLRPRPKLISKGKCAGGDRLCSRLWQGMRS